MLIWIIWGSSEHNERDSYMHRFGHNAHTIYKNKTVRIWILWASVIRKIRGFLYDSMYWWVGHVCLVEKKLYVLNEKPCKQFVHVSSVENEVLCFWMENLMNVLRLLPVSIQTSTQNKVFISSIMGCLVTMCLFGNQCGNIFQAVLPHLRWETLKW